jgi:hypothetical protein
VWKVGKVGSYLLQSNLTLLELRFEFLQAISQPPCRLDGSRSVRRSGEPYGLGRTVVFGANTLDFSQKTAVFAIELDRILKLRYSTSTCISPFD